MSALILETQGLSKSFASFAAVSDVSLKVTAGSLHALIGPNGAGKSTLFNLVTKFLKPTRGTILYRGFDVTGYSPSRLARMGVARSFQVSSVFAELTVKENVLMALMRQKNFAWRMWRSPAILRSLDEPAHELLARFGLAEQAEIRAKFLSYGKKRALELALAMAIKPELLLLDEPSSGVGHEDLARLTQVIREVSRTCTVLMVEHNLKLVAALATRISVLQRGRLIAEGSYDEVRANPQVIEAYLGREPHA